MLYNKPMDATGGVEFATFRLKQGVSEARLIELSNRVEAEFLCQQQELVFHVLLRGHNGVYADVAIASSQQKAEEYCRQWLDNPVARQYLELLDDHTVDMSFWSRIN